MQSKEQKIQCLHPAAKHAPAISVQTYRLFEKAIIAALKNGQQLSFTDLMDRVKDHFRKNKVQFNGSVDWFGITVKNHLEAIGMIETCIEKGKKLNRLKV